MQEHALRSEHATTIALDRHARSVTLAALDLATGETRGGRLADCPSAEMIVDWAKWATEPLRFACESGPCGFQLAREIRAMGIDCDIIAVTSIPRSTEDKRPEDDRRDAQSLLEAVTAPSSKCKAVHIPSEESEAARDLCRAYDDMVLATKRLKMQFSAMLPRHGFVWNERTPKGNLRLTWTKEYIKWARSIRLPAEAENQTLKFYLRGVLDGLDRCGELKRTCLELAQRRPLQGSDQGREEAERREGCGRVRAGSPDVGDRQHRAGRAGAGLTPRTIMTSTASESWFGGAGEARAGALHTKVALGACDC